MPKMKKENHLSKYLNDLEDWQEHQYGPGRYLDNWKNFKKPRVMLQRQRLEMECR
ncbi:hypothetical protein REC12_22930 [Desulfosporosinus sp. PR]|uniref:hypothetical protein n=1 Tax=Candidatus Desulfosporosinus nitrosoreducens TaxID=3401928 RepID=UPI002800337F|nr:hypothetical protein [Desulfosporosinus sp. PR]MDQ7096455.1 hypothetical protein [Desulfosporosinus sp. PR]